jgi:hypothetical protein
MSASKPKSSVSRAISRSRLKFRATCSLKLTTPRTVRFGSTSASARRTAGSRLSGLPELS